jgi:hypothetical protein
MEMARAGGGLWNSDPVTTDAGLSSAVTETSIGVLGVPPGAALAHVAPQQFESYRRHADGPTS